MSTPENIRGNLKRKASDFVGGERARSSEPGPSKQACVACRQRKIRCNAEQPCQYCASKKKDCVYGPAFRRAQCAQAHVDALEAKVRELESLPQLLSSRSDAPKQSPQSTTGTTWQGMNRSTSHAASVPGDAACDLMLPQPSRRPPKRYGKSTSLHFALNIKASATAMAEDGTEDATSPKEHIADADDGEEEEWLLESTGQSPGMSQLLPHRRLAKILFERYFTAVHPIWPMLLETESRERFDQTWISDEPPEPLWMVQLNLIMCLACQQCESEVESAYKLSGNDATTDGREFYQRAQGYVYANAFATNNIAMVQALLLMALYQQGAMRFNEFYLTVGHATRIAQSLGLHISRPELESVQPQHREVRRRIWWACFCMDRISSMLYGRPMGIPYGQFSDYQDLLPRPIDDPSISLNQPQPDNVPSINSFFRHSVRLYHVMDNVLLKLRNAKKTAYFDLQKASSDVQIQTPVSNINSLISLFTTILQMDGHLLSWHEYLPPHLRFSLDNLEDIAREDHSWIQRQRHHLRSRFLGMRMLLHRQTVLFLLQPSERRNWPQNGIQEWPPLFSDCYSDTLVGGHTPIRRQGVPSSVETTLTHLSASICVASATLQIEAVKEYLGSRMIGEWRDFNSVFNALCILSGAMALHREDIKVVVPDMTGTISAIRSGFAMIRHISTNPGLASTKLRQSERLLEKLGRATMMVSNNENDSATSISNALDGATSSWKPNSSSTKLSAARPVETTAALVPTPFQPSSNPRELASSHIRNLDPANSSHDHPHGVSHHTIPHLTHGVSGSEVVDRGANSFDWSIQFDPSRPGANMAVTREDMLNPNMLPEYDIPNGSPLNDGLGMLDGEDSIQSLFHHSFDIWGSLDSMDIENVDGNDGINGSMRNFLENRL
ncbi:MAG: hypothetical protein Q9228_005961 [Teloschistes exilis]